MYKRRRSSVARLALCIAFLALCGCGDRRPATYPVQGSVRFQGDGAVPVGTVEFRLKSTGEKARGKIDARGRFTLKTFGDKDGALPGEHQVVVIQHFDPQVLKTREVPADAQLPDGENHSHDRPPPLVHPRYASYATSPLTATVKPQAKNAVVLEVEAAPQPRHPKR